MTRRKSPLQRQDERYQREQARVERAAAAYRRDQARKTRAVKTQTSAPSHVEGYRRGTEGAPRGPMPSVSRPQPRQTRTRLAPRGVFDPLRTETEYHTQNIQPKPRWQVDLERYRRTGQLPEPKIQGIPGVSSIPGARRVGQEIQAVAYGVQAAPAEVVRSANRVYGESAADIKRGRFPSGLMDELKHQAHGLEQLARNPTAPGAPTAILSMGRLPVWAGATGVRQGLHAAREGRVGALAERPYPPPREFRLPEDPLDVGPSLGRASSGGAWRVTETEGGYRRAEIIPDPEIRKHQGVEAPEGQVWYQDKARGGKYFSRPEKFAKEVEPREGKVWRAHPTEKGKFIEVDAPSPTTGYYSRAADVMYAQKAIDWVRHKYPESGAMKGPVALRGLRGRAAWQMERNEAILREQKAIQDIPDGEFAVGMKEEWDQLVQRVGEALQDERALWKSEFRRASYRKKLPYLLKGGNNAMRLAVFYLAPKYGPPNFLGNLALNFLQQGPVGLAKSHKQTIKEMMDAKDNPRQLAQIDAASGIGLARGHAGAEKAPGEAEGMLPAPTGLAGPTTQLIAHAWSKILDLQFRRSAWIHEATKAGYKGESGRQKLLNDPEHRAKFLEVTQRARDNILDYSRLGQFERSLTNFLFIYPFTKASTVYLGQLAANRPLTTAAMLAAGEAGKRHEQQAGPQPSFQKGYLRLGGGPTGHRVSSLDAVNPLGGGTSALSAIGGHLTGQPIREEYLTSFTQPFIRSALNAAYRYDPYFGRELDEKTPVESLFLEQLLSQSPQFRLAEGLKEPTEGREDVLYPMSRADYAKQFLGGSIVPRPENPQERIERATQEYKDTLDYPQKIRFSTQEQTKSYTEEAKRLGWLPKDAENLPPQFRTAIGHLEGRKLYREKMKQLKGERELAPKQRILADLNYLHDKGIMNDKTYIEFNQFLGDLTEEEAKGSQYLYNEYFKDLYGERLNDMYKAFKEKGSSVKKWSFNG